MDKISELREKIDGIDDKLAELFIERISLSKEIGKIKKLSGKNVLDSDRESEIIKRLTENGKLDESKQIEKLYERIFEISKEVQF